MLCQLLQKHAQNVATKKLISGHHKPVQAMRPKLDSSDAASVSIHGENTIDTNWDDIKIIKGIRVASITKQQ